MLQTRKQILGSLKRCWAAALISLPFRWCDECHGVGFTERGVCFCTANAICKRIRAEYVNYRFDIDNIQRQHTAHGTAFSRPSQEFRADVELLFRRCARELDSEMVRRGAVVPIEGLHCRIARIYLRRNPSFTHQTKAVAPGISRRTYFRGLNRLKLRVARHAVELLPYALFPTQNYMSQSIWKAS